MPRDIPLDSTTAGLQRLSLLPQAEIYGLMLDPADTAPFNVVWNLVRGACEVRWKRTVIGHVEPYAVALVVRDAYDADLDFALTRAMQNAVRVTDQVGRLIREEKKAGNIGMVGKETPPFTVQINQPLQALIGAECADPHLYVRMGRRNETVYRHGNGSVYTQLHETQDGIRVERGDYATMGLKESPFMQLLRRGETEWARRFDADTLMTSVADLCADSEERPIDRATVMDEIQMRWESKDHDAFRDKIRHAEIAIGAFTARSADVMSFDPQSVVVFHNGLRIGEANGHDDGRVNVEIRAPFAEIPDLDRAMGRLLDLMQLHLIGATPEDVPAFSSEKIEDLVRVTDMGYDL